jgi:hypothetical protein
MTATKRDSLVCTVCRKPLLIGEEYLVRMHDGHPRTVHRHLCFPPAAQAEREQPAEVRPG